MWRALDPTATKACTHSLFLHHLGHPWPHQGSAGKGWTPPPTGSSLLSPARGSWEHQRHEKPASSEKLWSEHSHVQQPLLRRHESRAHSFYLKTMYFAQQKPPHSTAAPQNRGWFPHLQLHPDLAQEQLLRFSATESGGLFWHVVLIL